VFQASKFIDPLFREMIRRASTPQQAIEAAKALKAQQRSDWLQVNVPIMRAIVEIKLQQYPSIKSKLAATSERLEYDVSNIFWASNKGKGRNELGKILMRARAGEDTPEVIKGILILVDVFFGSRPQ